MLELDRDASAFPGSASGLQMETAARRKNIQEQQHQNVKVRHCQGVYIWQNVSNL